MASRPALALGLSLALISPALADRTVTDQIGREVTIPDTVERAVVLQHQTLNISVQLDAQGQVAGVLDEWKKQLGPDFARLAPGIEDLGTPGGLTSVNIEELLALKPDVVFVTNYAPAEMREQIESVGLPVVAISLLDVPPEEAVKQSPVVSGDEAAAYDTGFREGVRLIAEVFGKAEAGEDLIAAATESRALVAERLADVAESDRVRAYMANPDLTTYGTGKYTGLMMAYAGAKNVAADSIQGYKQVTMEEILGWNPQVIFVQDRYPQVVDEIKAGAAWQPIDAVTAGRVWLMPEYAKAWGYPMPEAMALGELWMAKTLYPERFEDIDMEAHADGYYRRFYRVPYQP
ncbi:ABC transporter substrate-binding protein [Paracoccus sp. AS002]|uniref:ABC transporter substrate-binding protein n=1 Tax=Paracoccus sp. AS002 TaxID=3019545 RepID=UPI0023E75657|nr:ABC transporter substrate-binding protein [Paracoccus sp. AS002]MDF3906847.1 ABC transporter substrate-binding protein [Paracoccus sp. AS002]